MILKICLQLPLKRGMHISSAQVAKKSITAQAVIRRNIHQVLLQSFGNRKMKKTFILTNEFVRTRAIQTIMNLELDHKVRISPADLRNLDQNAKMWAMLTDISKQVNWYGQYLHPEEWKDVLTAALKKQKVVPGIEGGFVAIGARTSQMSKREMMDLITLAYAFGNEHNVVWTEKEEEEGGA